MSYGEYPYEGFFDPLYGPDEQDRWERRYANYLDQQMEAQYHAELATQFDADYNPIKGKYMEYPDSLAHQVLHCPMVQPNDANAATVGEFLGSLLSTLWLENEGFSGKRPLGNSDWQWQVYKSLVKAELAVGTLYAEDGYEELEDWTRESEIAADELILQSIKLMCHH